MASNQSYTITRSNNKTESEALSYLLKSQKNFVALDKETRKHVMEVFNLDHSFSRAFDLILFTGKGDLIVSKKNLPRMVLVELKTTKKKINDIPRGFFFGATENEFKLANKLGDKYLFCFVSLHPESKSYELLTLLELEKLMRTKRIQYQINL